MTKIRWFALPLVALPLYSITSSLQACSSSSGVHTATGHSALTCNAGEISKKLNDGDACCRTLADGSSSCRKAGEDGPGAPCTTIGATKPGDGYTATFDVCVEEECSGDRRCTEFPLVVEKTTGTLTCVAKATGPEWELGAASTVHRVERACLTSRTEVCRGPGYSSSNPAVYGYSSAYFRGYGETCAYGGYGYGPSTINVRSLFLIASTCTAGGGASAPCPVNDL
jgi:hypothetical protein